MAPEVMLSPATNYVIVATYRYKKMEKNSKSKSYTNTQTKIGVRIGLHKL